MSWERDDTERWLNDFPLPPDFTWRGQKVWPRYQLKHGYGQWLRTAGPYHVALRGLFALVHEILAVIPAGAPMPSADRLVAELRAIELQQPDLFGPLEAAPAEAAELDRGLTQSLADQWPEQQPH